MFFFVLTTLHDEPTEMCHPNQTIIMLAMRPTSPVQSTSAHRVDSSTCNRDKLTRHVLYIICGSVVRSFFRFPPARGFFLFILFYNVQPSTIKAGELLYHSTPPAVANGVRHGAWQPLPGTRRAFGNAVATNNNNTHSKQTSQPNCMPVSRMTRGPYSVEN